MFDSKKRNSDTHTTSPIHRVHSFLGLLFMAFVLRREFHRIGELMPILQISVFTRPSITTLGERGMRR